MPANPFAMQSKALRDLQRVPPVMCGKVRPDNPVVRPGGQTIDKSLAVVPQKPPEPTFDTSHSLDNVILGKPEQVIQVPPVAPVITAAPAVPAGMSTTTKIAIGVGVVGVVGLTAYLLLRK